MQSANENASDQFDPRFKIFHELMPHKVREILLISSPYCAWIMEEDCRLSEAIVHEYRGLNLSHPPRLHWVASAHEASIAIDKHSFDLAIVMPQSADLSLAEPIDKIKEKLPSVPIIQLCDRTTIALNRSGNQKRLYPFDRTFVWSGDSKFLLSCIKSVEDQLNAAYDTHLAGIRVILFIEDSPEYLTSLLPVLYQELVTQTQAVMEEGLNEEHRLLAMRARPKILIAENFEEAVKLFEQYEHYVLGVISDVRFPRNNKLDDDAGIRLLNKIHMKRFDIPLLLTSSEQANLNKAVNVNAAFVNKNSSTLHGEVRTFFIKELGFGAFVFRTPDGLEIGSAKNLQELERNLLNIPDDLFYEHWIRHDFSRWLFTRGEIILAAEIRAVTEDDFDRNLSRMRQYLFEKIHNHRMQRLKGVLVDFEPKNFDIDTDFLKIGDGSLGGKARGLAFFSSWLDRHPALRKKFERVQIYIPQTLVITTESFQDLLHYNELESIIKKNLSDKSIAEHFLNARFPVAVRDQLRCFLSHIKYPIAVRSSSLLEDAQFRSHAGLYKTYMLPNNHKDVEYRLGQLINAIKLVYASTYFEAPRSFAQSVGNRIEEEKMAVIIQQIVGSRYGDYFYPAISGVVQSQNYYPFGKMKREDGIATIVMGMGKTAMEGRKGLRFSPCYPSLLPQRSTIDDILDNSQREFLSLKMSTPDFQLGIDDETTLEKRQIMDASDDYPVRALAGTYVADERRIRTSANLPGLRVMTFDSVLKYEMFPMADILRTLLSIGQEGIGSPIEIEFSINMPEKHDQLPQIAILQIRPMGAREEMITVDIRPQDYMDAFCVSHQSLGNTINNDMRDIVYVKPEKFDPARTQDIANQIDKINSCLVKTGRKYIIIGPGRWGSADTWLGIPVRWNNICGVGAIVETVHPLINVEPSQGSHFFHNITALSINYLNVNNNGTDRIDWRWITNLPIINDMENVCHAAALQTFCLKVDGRQNIGVILNR